MKKYDKNEDFSYALGTTVAIECLKFRPEIGKKLYISPKQNRDETYQLLISLAKSNHIPVIENNEKIFKELSSKDNVMTILEFQKKQYPLDNASDHCVLVNPSNMGNLGTIIRCMVGFSLFDLAIITPACDIYDPKVIRASMGAFFHLNFALYPSFEAYEKEAGKGHHHYPFMLQTKNALKDAKIEHPYSIIFGNEATGLPKSFLEVGTPLLIPHSGFIDSLNLDNAAAIGIYEFTKDKNN